MLVEGTSALFSDLRIPGIVCTERGTLLATYECRRTAIDWAEIDLKVVRSEDGGEHFTPVLQIPSEGGTMNNPLLIADGDTVHFLFCKNYKELYYARSTDDGVSFSVPVHVPIEDETDFFYSVVAVGPGHGIVHNGTLLAPLWFGYNREDPHAHHPSFVGTLYSKDGGESWHLGKPFSPDALPDASESAMAVLADGRVMINTRSESNLYARSVAVSPNGYEDWSAYTVLEELPDPICFGSILSHGGVLYHVNCASKTRRENLTVRESRDGFTYTNARLVNASGGYADLTAWGGELCVLHEMCNEQSGRWEIHLTKLPL